MGGSVLFFSREFYRPRTGESLVWLPPFLLQTVYAKEGIVDTIFDWNWATSVGPIGALGWAFGFCTLDFVEGPAPFESSIARGLQGSLNVGIDFWPLWRGTTWLVPTAPSTQLVEGLLSPSCP